MSEPQHTRDKPFETVAPVDSMGNPLAVGDYLRSNKGGEPCRQVAEIGDDTVTLRYVSGVEVVRENGPDRLTFVALADSFWVKSTPPSESEENDS